MAHVCTVDALAPRQSTRVADRPSRRHAAPDLAVLLRPVIFVQAAGASDSVVAILVDVSRSMRIADAGTSSAVSTRIERAAAIVRDLQQQLGSSFRVELVTFGEAVAKGDVNQLAAEARRSDLSGALASLVERYHGRRLGGVVVVSDGGDTAGEEVGSASRMTAPVFAIGVGNPEIARDREVINISAGEPLLSDSSIDLSVSAASHGFGKAPIEIRVSGKRTSHRRAPCHPFERRRSGSRSVYRVAVAAQRTVYSVEIPVDGGEAAAENNVRRILVPPQGP